MSFYNGPNRFVCSVLEEMRNMLKVLTSSNMERYKEAQAMLIEEAQTLVNRMESALEDWADIRRAHKEIKNLKKEIRQLEDKKDKLE